MNKIVKKFFLNHQVFGFLYLLQLFVQGLLFGLNLESLKLWGFMKNNLRLYMIVRPMIR